MSDDKKDIDIDDISGVETTGHSWDGIKELNNPLPRWWLYMFYISVAFSVVWMFLMPAIPALPGLGTNTKGYLNTSDRDIVAADLESLQSERAAQSTQLLNASLEEIRSDQQLRQFADAMGSTLFADNCATCHGSGGRGNYPGYPSLADDVWLWNGTLDGIEYTIRHGIRHDEDIDTRFSAMPAYGRDGLLSRQDIRDLTEYVLDLNGRSEDAEAVARARANWNANCVACHGQNGRGDQSQGAPNLTDGEWLFGESRSDIYNTIFNARNAHMPAWEGRLDDASIKALAVYVNTRGEGE